MIVRKIDQLGRSVIPIEMRKELDLNIKDSVEIILKGKEITFRKHQARCTFCGGLTQHKMFYKNKCICDKCLKEIKNI